MPLLIFVLSLLKLHVVHIKEKYQTLEEAESDSAGIALLAFFFEVRLSESLMHLL